MNIIDKVPLHKGILDVNPQQPNVVSFFHTHVLIDLPVETDIYYALRQEPRTNHFIGCGRYIYEIDPNNLEVKKTNK